MSVLQAAVVPVIPTMSAQLGVGPAEIGWVLTANLLSAAVCTPVLGKFADRRGGRRVLIGILVVVVVGSVLCVLATSLPLLVIGRVLQGSAFAIFPIGVAVLRMTSDDRRLAHAIGLMSGMMAGGAGLGMVAAGVLVADDGPYQRVFWMLLALSVLSLGLVCVAVPATPGAAVPGPGADVAGVFLLATGLSAVLLALAEGPHRSAGLAVGVGLGGLVCLVLWCLHERRTAAPLVPPRSLAGRRVTPAHIAAALVGAAMYFQFLGIAQFVQAEPELVGYGFGASVLAASVVFLLPGAAAGFVAAAVSGRLVHRFRGHRVLAAMCVIGVIAFVVLVVARDRPWQLMVAAVVVNVFVSGSYAALPSLLTDAVPAADTAVANGVNAIARIVGSSVRARPWLFCSRP
ncbi:major facilitator superfamily multidrug resistance protein [Gordonia terrae C-6]|uniref:Major facilitator superfamily multidrug resistance protein n=2 Tax=Gordonia terrae TaxID=2055 RepID=R7YBS6_9ACTN|nr:major facilitator superfamily multidrug resistance protein [Gordonia terrae C-6]